MTSVSISELQRNVHDILKLTSRGPVTITHNGREEYALLSISEYQRLKRRDRQVLGVQELGEQDICDIAAANVPEEYAYLNELLGEK